MLSECSRESVCRHPRIRTIAHRHNVSDIRCADCGHWWLEVHPPDTEWVRQSPLQPDPESAFSVR